MPSWVHGESALRPSGRGARRPRRRSAGPGRPRVGRGVLGVRAHALSGRVPLPARRHRSLGLLAPRVEGRGATMDGSAGYARLAMRVAIRVARLSTALLASELARRRSPPATTSACRRSAFEGAFRQLRMEAGSSLADHAVAIAVPHIPIGGVRAVDRRGPVPARLPARDPSVPVRCFGGSLRRGESLRPRLCRARRPRSIPPAARARDQPIRTAAG